MSKEMKITWFIIVFTFLLVITSTRNSTAEELSGVCSQSAQTLLAACLASVKEDSLVHRANCLNLSGSQQQECEQDLADEKEENTELCKDQLDWRLAACKKLGDQAYDPAIVPNDFDNDYTNLSRTNPYFPIKIGNKWKYEGGGESNTVEITSQTKLIDGVTCIVFRDKVFADGALKENTDDWFAQALDGTVWYFGEEVKDYETFDGDKPKRPELVSIDGSFKAGVDEAKPGIIFLATPKKGSSYLEEFSLSNAEDLTTILSTTYSFGHDPDLDRLVPRQLAERFCSAGDCVVTRNISLLEPKIIERKYYARDIGVFLEVELTDGEISQLVDCNFDRRCNGLPNP